MLIYLILMYNGSHLRSRGTDIVRIEGTNGPQQRGEVVIYIEYECECKQGFFFCTNSLVQSKVQLELTVIRQLFNNLNDDKDSF